MSDEVLEQRLLPKRQLSSVHACGLVTLSSLCVLMMGGLVFGFSSIFPVLYTERVFVESCGEEAARACRAEGATTSKCCNRQFEQYSLMSSAALFAADGVFVFCARANRPPALPPIDGLIDAHTRAQTARRWTGSARGRASSRAASSAPSAFSPSASTSTSAPTHCGTSASSHSASPAQVQSAPPPSPRRRHHRPNPARARAGIFV